MTGWVHRAPKYGKHEAWNARMLSRLEVLPCDEEQAKKLTIDVQPVMPFGVIYRYELHTVIETQKPRPDHWWKENATESFSLIGFVDKKDDPCSRWVLKWFDMDAVSNEYWPVFPTLAHACAWARDYLNIHQGECSHYVRPQHV